MASKSARDPRCLEDALAALPDVSNNIIKSDEHYCNAGAFSDVYRRKYQDDSGAGTVEVAVKSFRFLFTVNESETEKTEGMGVRKMIRRELGIWRRLKHPNIVPFLGIAYGFGRPEHASLVSLWMSNGSLQNFLEEHDNQLTIGHRLQLLSDIASGLSYLHSFPFPITHGDLSCNNVLLGCDYSACLTDFGYSSMVGDLPEASQYLQMTTLRPGTLRWAAPEYFLANIEQGIKPTTQSDIYSFGNLGLLERKQPWSEIQRDAVVIVQLSLGKKPKRPSSPSIEDHHWELIERCWSPVGDRPSAKEVVSSLEQFLHPLSPFPPLVDTMHTVKPKKPEDPPPTMETPQPRPRTVSLTATENVASSTEGRTDETTKTRRSDARQRNPSFDTPIAPILRGVRVASAVDKLKALALSQELTAHQALIRHLQFSPNGKYLATSSWDRTSVIFRVGESFTTHRILVHVRGFVGQVAWSPNGKMLLTRLIRAVKVWSEDGVCRKTIDRQDTVQSIIWLPTGDAFLSVEGSEVVKLDLHGKVLDTYHLGQVQLTNVAVTPDCCRLVGVGPSITPPSGPQPSRRTRVEKRIIVYNMQSRSKESQTPIANDMRDIAMARKTQAVLISLEGAAPQLWKLEIIRDRDRVKYAQTSRLNLKHTFALKGPVDIAGPCHFGGKDDHFVLCAGKAGDVHIWDRETAAFLHYIQPQTGVEDLTCIGWNYATDEPMMLATGSHDGTVRVYSTASLGEESDESYSERQTEQDR